MKLKNSFCARVFNKYLKIRMFNEYFVNRSGDGQMNLQSEIVLFAQL